MRNIWLFAGVAALAVAAPAAAGKGGHGGHGGGGGGHSAKVQHGGGGGHQKASRGGGGGGRQAKAERGGRGGNQFKANRGGGGKREARAMQHNGGGKSRQQFAAHGGERRGGGKAKQQLRAERGDFRRHGQEHRQAFANQQFDRKEVRARERMEHGRPVRIAREDVRREHGRNLNRDRFAYADRRDDRFAYANGRNDYRDRRDEYRDRRDDFFARDYRYPVRYARYEDGRYRYDGCPPGLRAKHNGCVPPGQAKKLFGRALPAVYASSYLPAYYRNWYPDTDRYYYRTGDDFIYRVNRRDNLIDGYMPLFGYAGYNSYDQYDPYYYPDYYYAGEPYPLDYVNFYNVPAAYQPYYEDQGDWLYRYGDGAIYRVNRSSGLVDSIVQLLAGDLAVGSPLPVGYDVYNVPYAYRDRYYDTPDRWYRYNDGYIYQVDPKTRLIQAVIQALV